MATRCESSRSRMISSIACRLALGCGSPTSTRLMKACEALTDGVGEGEQAYADGYRVRRVAGDGGADCLPREVGWSSASGLPETSAFNTPNSTAKAQPARDHGYPTRPIAFG